LCELRANGPMGLECYLPVDSSCIVYLLYLVRIEDVRWCKR